MFQLSSIVVHGTITEEYIEARFVFLTSPCTDLIFLIGVNMIDALLHFKSTSK